MATIWESLSPGWTRKALGLPGRSPGFPAMDVWIFGDRIAKTSDEFCESLGPITLRGAGEADGPNPMKRCTKRQRHSVFYCPTSKMDFDPMQMNFCQEEAHSAVTEGTREPPEGSFAFVFVPRWGERVLRSCRTPNASTFLTSPRFCPKQLL